MLELQMLQADDKNNNREGGGGGEELDLFLTLCVRLGVIPSSLLSKGRTEDGAACCTDVLSQLRAAYTEDALRGAARVLEDEGVIQLVASSSSSSEDDDDDDELSDVDKQRGEEKAVAVEEGVDVKENEDAAAVNRCYAQRGMLLLRPKEGGPNEQREEGRQEGRRVDTHALSVMMPRSTPTTATTATTTGSSSK